MDIEGIEGDIQKWWTAMNLKMKRLNEPEMCKQN